MPQREDDEHTHDQYADHMRRIDVVKTLFHRGEINVDEKRQQIAEENAFYYGPDYKSPATGERIGRPPRVRNEVMAILEAARSFSLGGGDDA